MTGKDTITVVSWIQIVINIYTGEGHISSFWKFWLSSINWWEIIRFLKQKLSIVSDFTFFSFFIYFRKMIKWLLPNNWQLIRLKPLTYPSLIYTVCLERKQRCKNVASKLSLHLWCSFGWFFRGGWGKISILGQSYLKGIGPRIKLY